MMEKKRIDSIIEKKKKIRVRKTMMISVLTASMLLVGSLVGCQNSSQKQTEGGGRTKTESTEGENGGEFAAFRGEDLDGNSVDESLLKENKATVLNFWFNGCSACVSEMPDLEKFNEKLKEKNAEIIGVNVGSAGNSKAIAEAKELLKNQGASYRNIMIQEGDSAVRYMDEILAFPTTIVVDENGKIIGEPICGSLNEELMQEIMETVESITGK